MGWSSGSQLAEEVWRMLKKKRMITDSNKQKVAEKLISLFEDHDADDWDVDTKGGLYKTAFPKGRPGGDDYDEEC